MTQQKDIDNTNPYILEDDLAEFQPYLDDIHIPEDQQREFLELLWSIMIQFASLGFGMDTVSHAIAAQLSKTDEPEQRDMRLTEVFCATEATTKPKKEEEVASR